VAVSCAKDLQQVVKTKKTELLFLALFLRLLKPGGRAAVIVPDGVLFGSSNAHKSLRRMLIEEQKLDAVVSLPGGVFKPYAGVSTAILLFTKTNSGGTDHVWFYDVDADGWSLDHKRTPLLEETKLGCLPKTTLGADEHTKNNLPDILGRWQERERQERKRPRTAQSFCVPKADIAAQGYDLSLIDAGRLEEYKAWRVNDFGIRDITLRHDLHALSKFFSYAIKQRWTGDNPVRNVTIPSDANAIRIHVLTFEEEREYFLRAVTHRDLTDLAGLMLNQGMRPDEVACLQKTDVDLDRGQLHITSGKSPAARRTLDLTTESRTILARRMPRDSNWVFPSSRNPANTLRGSTGRMTAFARQGRKPELHSTSSFTTSATLSQRASHRLGSTLPHWRRSWVTARFGWYSATSIQRLNTSAVRCSSMTRS